MEIELFVITFYPEITLTGRTNTIFNSVRFIPLWALTSHWYLSLHNVIDSGLGSHNWLLLRWKSQKKPKGQRAREWWKDWLLALAHVWHCFVPSPSSSSQFAVWMLCSLPVWDHRMQMCLSFSSSRLLTWPPVRGPRPFSAGFILYVSIFLIFFFFTIMFLLHSG